MWNGKWFFTSRHWCDYHNKSLLERPKQLLDNFKFVILVCLSWKVQNNANSSLKLSLKRQSGQPQMLTAAYEKLYD